MVFRGLRAKGDVTVDIEFENGRLKEAVLHAGSQFTDDINVRYGESLFKLSKDNGRQIKITV